MTQYYPFSKVISDNTWWNPKIKKEDYFDYWKFPIVDQWQQFIWGYTNDENLLCEASLPCIIFWDHTRVFKYIDFPFAIWADGVKVLECSDKLDTKYVYYFLRQVRLGWKEGYNRNFKYLKEISIPLPPLATQQSIASKLDQIQSLIDLKKDAISKTQELTKSVFLEMFGDPMRNEKGWEVRKLMDVCDVRDWTHDSPKYQTSWYPLITSKNIKNWAIDFSDLNYISEEDYDAINRRSNVDDWDILMPMIWTIWNPVIVKKNRDFAIKNVALMKFSKPWLVNSYLLWLLNSCYLAHKVSENHKWWTQKFMSLWDIRWLEIPLPPLPLQQQFADRVEKIQQMLDEQKLALSKLEELFQATMQECFG